MDLADNYQPAWNAIRRIRKQGFRFALCPTALDELMHAADDYARPQHQWLGQKSLSSIGGTLPDFGFADLTDEELDLVDAAVRRLRRENLLPHEERHDLKIVCETAVLGSDYLLTDDTHLLGIPQKRLAEVLRQMDLRSPRIISYASILT